MEKIASKYFIGEHAKFLQNDILVVEVFQIFLTLIVYIEPL